MILAMSASSSVTSARVVSFEVARYLVEQHAVGVCSGEVETVDLLAGLGRVLAEGIWRTVTFLLLIGLLATDTQCGRRIWPRFRRDSKWLAR